MSSTAEQVSDAVLRWVTFRLGNEVYGVDVLHVQEVLRFSEISPVPGTPGHVLGIINLRGNIVTVIDARVRLGLAPRETDDATRIVIVETANQVVGMLVDSVAEVVELTAGDIEMAPGAGDENRAPYIQGVSSREGNLVIILDLNRLFSGNE